MTPTPEMILDHLGIEYHQRTGRLAFCCPMHADRNPSAAFYTDSKLAYCFSCDYCTDTIQFYAKVTEKSRAAAIRDLEATFGAIPETERKTAPPGLAKARREGERTLQALKHLPRKEHAALGETLDRILLAYERGQINDAKLANLLRTWRRGYTQEKQPEEAPDLA